MRTDLNIIIVFFTIIIVTILVIHTPDVYAVDFVDHTGYTPDWAQSMGNYQALDRCNEIVGENSADGNLVYGMGCFYNRSGTRFIQSAIKFT